MKAVVIKKHGNASVLSFESVREPKLRKEHAIVKVNYCAVNHLDLWVRQGIKGKKIKFPYILGCDVCGELQNSFGKFKKNDKVVVYPAVESKTPMVPFTLTGGFGEYNGGYAQYIQVPKQCIVKKPSFLSDQEACALNVSYLTSWSMLQKIKAKKGNTILVWGGSSGVGTASILLAKAIGCKVISVTSGSKIKQVKKIGADIIIDRKKQNVLQKILDATKKHGVDGVIDHVGAKTWSTSIDALKIHGIMTVCGITTGPIAQVNIPTVYNKEIQIHGTYMGTKNQLTQLHKFMKTKKVKPIIDSIIPLKNAKIAHKKLELQKQFGKIILKI